MNNILFLYDGRLRMRCPANIKVILYGLCDALIFFVIVSPAWLPRKFVIVPRFVLLAYLLIRIIQCKNIPKTYQRLIILSLIYILINFISSIANMVSLKEVYQSVYHSCLPFIAVTLPTVSFNRNNIIRVFKWSAAAFVIIDVLMVFILQQGISTNSVGQPVYFSGGKFGVCYMYLIWMLLNLTDSPKQTIIEKVLITTFGVLLCWKADCNTGLLIVFAFGLFSVLPKRLFTKKNIILFFGTILLVNIMIVFFKVQENIQLIHDFIVNVLHRTTELTGRYSVWSRITEIMSGHWIYGWGWTSDRVTQVSKLANMQNGLLQVIYSGGIIALVIYLSIIICVIGKLFAIKDMQTKRLLSSALTAFFIADIVEIPFSSGICNVVIMLIILCSFQENKAIRLLLNKERKFC